MLLHRADEAMEFGHINVERVEFSGSAMQEPLLVRK